MKHHVLWITLSLLLGSCAQVREPQGGPKDTSPPQLVGSEPENGSVRFRNDKIVLHFDERVKLDRVRERLFISPPLDKAPDVAVVRGTDVVITLNAPLKASTTYTFHIGEAVLDLSESNPATGLTYVLSTGGHVDSLTMTGRVVDAFTGQPVADALVLLHDDRDTGDVRTARPTFFTRSGKDGRFRLSHLPGGPMRLHALLDRNGNFRYDLPTEEIAFSDGPVDPRDSAGHELRLFRAPSSTQFVAGAKVLPERGWQLAMARPAGELSLVSMDREGGRLNWWTEWNNARDTATFWPSDTTLLPGQRFILHEDGDPLDTLTYRAITPMPFNVGVKAKNDPVTGRWWLEATRPVASVDPAHAELRTDTARVEWTVHPDSVRGRTIGLGLSPEAGKPMELLLYPKAVTAVMGGTNDTLRLSLSAPDPRTLGKLQVELLADSTAAVQGPFIVQLIGAQGRVARETGVAALPALVAWSGISPGSYTLKAIRDVDDDGHWTTGSYSDGRQPEPVFLDPEPVVVRAGWALERSWAITGR